MANRFNTLISNELKKDIHNDYVLLGLPRHMNLGDTLIWEAEEQLLSHVDKKCLSMYFWNDRNINVSKDTTIVFSGGGTWDDIWNTIDYIEYMLSKFPDNKFVFLPNDVWYNNKDRADKTKDVINHHNNEIVLFSRNNQSFKIAKTLFPNVKNALVPDVVLGWDIDKYLKENNLKKETGSGSLHIVRKDRERTEYKLNNTFSLSSDWPTITKRPDYINNTISCKEWHDNIKPRLVRAAIEFVNKYKTVYSARMHGAILAMLLNKETVFIDNTYHKVRSLYDTWLSDKKNVKIIK